MAWIQVHQQLKDHRKLLQAADELEVEPVHMLGMLISFWLWALDNAPSGSLEGISSRTIARAAQWSGEPDVFVSAIADAGLLREEALGVLKINDWYEYAGKLIDQREAEKERSRRRRAASSNDQQTTAGRPPDDQQTTAGRLDQTILDQSIPYKEDLPPNPQGGTTPAAQERRFSEFWAEYPKKVGKKAAQTTWKRLRPDAELFEHIMQAVTAAKVSEQWNREGGRYIPNPATWLNQGRWDDELAPMNMQRPANTKTTEKGFNTFDVLAEIIAEEEGGALT
ncbi:MAG: hypothetical protein J6Q59_04510 [Paludibacteraceae bacterium]|nr:hypothetical protein [Paludibacteraceae bacterium]